MTVYSGYLHAWVDPRIFQRQLHVSPSAASFAASIPSSLSSSSSSQSAPDLTPLPCRYVSPAAEVSRGPWSAPLPPPSLGVDDTFVMAFDFDFDFFPDLCYTDPAKE